MSLHSHMRYAATIKYIIRKQHVVFCSCHVQTPPFRALFTQMLFCPKEKDPFMRASPNYVQTCLRRYSQKKEISASTESSDVAEKSLKTESSPANDDGADVSHNGQSRNIDDGSQTQNLDTLNPAHNTLLQRRSKASELLRSSGRGGVSVARRLGMKLPNDFWKSPEEAKTYLHPNATETDSDPSEVAKKEMNAMSDGSLKTESSLANDSDAAGSHGDGHSPNIDSDIKETFKQSNNPSFQRQSKAGELLRSSRRGGVSVTRRLGMMLPNDFWKSPEEAEKYLDPSDADSGQDHISTLPNSFKYPKSRSAPLMSLNPADRLNSMLRNETMVSEVEDTFETMTWENSDTNCKTEVKKVEYSLVPLEAGELALMNFFTNRRVFNRLVNLGEGKVYKSKRHGSVAHSDVLGQYEDSRLESSTGYTVEVKRPTLEDYCAVMRKIVVTPDIKVLSSAISHVGISPGDAILEAGTGQGVSALVFSQAVGATGLVHSVEKIPENHMKAQRSYYRWADSYDMLHVTDPWPRNVSFFHSALADFQSQIQYDMVFLDLPSPVVSIDAAISLVKPGKCILMYTPSPTRIVSFLKEAGERRLPLVLEGVWEEGRKMWHVRTKGVDHDHLVPLNMAQGGNIDFPTVFEKETAFIAKFRKIVPRVERSNDMQHFTGIIVRETLGDTLSQWWRSVTGQKTSQSEQKTSQSEQKTSQSEGSGRILKENDFVAIRAILQPKKRDRVQVVGHLTPGGVYSNNWGAILHTSLIGQPEGQIVRMLTGFLVYPFHVSLDEFLSLAWAFRFLSVKTVRLLQRLEDVRVGDKLLVVGDPPAIAPMALLMSRAVWHSGQVEAVSWVREQWPGNPVQKVDQWKAIYRTQTDQDWPDNIHVHCDCDGLPPDVTTGQFDGVAVCVTSQGATFCLDELVAVLKPKRYLTVLVESVTQVNSVLEFAHSHSSQLQLVDITEDTERKWHVRPVDERAGRFEPDYNETFICRPKPRKISKLRNTSM